MSGYPDNTFRPDMNLTRAEAVVILRNAVVIDDGLATVGDTVFDKAGVYGSSLETETIEGNVIIKEAGITLQNTIVNGNLTIAKEVGNGDVTLKSVIIKVV